MVYDGVLSPEHRQAIENVAMAAIGYDAERGDTIHVEGVPFDTSLQDQLARQLAEEEARMKEEEAQKAARRRIMAYGVMGLLVAGSLAIIIGLIVRRRKKAKTPMLDAEISEPIPVEELLREPEEIEPLEPKEESAEERSIKEYAKNNPDDAADLVRAWMLEDER